MSLAKPSPSLLQTPLFQTLAYLFLFIFAALIIVCLSYFALSYMADTSSEYEDLMAVKEDKEATTWTFSIIAAVSVVGVIIGGVMVHGGKGNLVLLTMEEKSAPNGIKGTQAEGEVEGSEKQKSKLENHPSPKPPPPEFIFMEGTAYSGDDVIRMYENLPENAIINCDLEFKDKFEECTVLKGKDPNVKLKGADAVVPLGNIINSILDKKKHFIAKCCTDKTRSTVIFTTMAINEELGVDSIGITMKDCLDTECTDHVLAKIARNKLYQKRNNPKFIGCQSNDSAIKGTTKIDQVVYKKDWTAVTNQVYLDCPKKFDPTDYSHMNYAMLYKYSLTNPTQKLAGVLSDTNTSKAYLQTAFNCSYEGSELQVLTKILTEMQ